MYHSTSQPTTARKDSRGLTCSSWRRCWRRSRKKGKMKNTDPIDQVFACGPEMMLKAVSELTAKYKIPSQLSLERYMKCGYGICGNCVVDPLGIRLCTEGPVVKNDACVKIEEFGKYHRDALGKKHTF